MIKIKHTETIDGKLVCKAKLVLIKEVNNPTFYSAIDGLILCKKKQRLIGYEEAGWIGLEPIFISETEICDTGEIYLSHIKQIIRIKQKGVIQAGDKILSLTEYFSSQLLQDIIDGRSVEGESYYLECELYGYQNENGLITKLTHFRPDLSKEILTKVNTIKLNQQNYVNIVDIKKEENWDYIFDK